MESLYRTSKSTYASTCSTGFYSPSSSAGLSQGLKPLLHQLKQEGYDPNKIEDPLYYLDPEENRYLRLTPERYQDIIEGRITL